MLSVKFSGTTQGEQLPLDASSAYDRIGAEIAQSSIEELE